ncbi:hypothetical protein SAMN06296036_11537 [Pseudobacteriovorax antillogorgiicola]|uniref:Uncharacterized protein n=1 Tax=Pseudobacteriovorax antillogorgiicola TaxID=1513793 RepID=A0A1Y6CDP3_9BACT|nr:hypothetical protein EDD56_11068 [Pseudobacteriovorax antillogorgiicola]SMF49055.1 hypothetical protein SAMN06296036_11537 [Pseudobacteriovorax antillogorgiicola]
MKAEIFSKFDNSLPFFTSPLTKFLATLFQNPTFLLDLKLARVFVINSSIKNLKWSPILYIPESSNPTLLTLA